MLWPFKKCPTAVQTATVVHTNGHNVVVAISLEMAANPVHISYRISYVFLLWYPLIAASELLINFTTHLLEHTQINLGACGSGCNYKFKYLNNNNDSI